jgi:16S rRNA pseudouridine516 synthase
MPVLRLDRMLSGEGLGTRKEIKQMMGRGAVTVNGKCASRPEIKVNTDEDVVCMQGVQIVYREHIYIMMNKPAGVISASDDPKEPTVIDLLPKELRRPGLFPAGRLDRDTEGLLIITDDGKFAHSILSPKKHVSKQYIAIIDAPVTPDQIEIFENGIIIDGGYACLPAKLEIVEETRVRVTIHEGKYHQIKRMFEALGREVLYLKRTDVGGLSLDKRLALGQSRQLAENELALASIYGK